MSAKHRMAVSRTPFMVKFKPQDAGRTVVYFARWSTAKGQMGPWSSPVYFTIANGGPALDVIEENERASKVKTITGDDASDGESPLKMAA